MPQVPCYECAFRRWLWAREFHHGLLGKLSFSTIENLEPQGTLRLRSGQAPGCTEEPWCFIRLSPEPGIANPISPLQPLGDTSVFGRPATAFRKRESIHQHNGLTIRTSVTFSRQNKLLRSQRGY